MLPSFEGGHDRRRVDEIKSLSGKLGVFCGNRSREIVFRAAKFRELFGEWEMRVCGMRENVVCGRYVMLECVGFRFVTEI